MNTDGVAIFKSSTFNIWPIFLSVNELDYKIRRNNTILVGLWFGLKKPNFHTFLPGFVDQCNTLITNGISWTFANTTFQSKVLFPIMASDSAARCLLQGLRQYNGDSSCPWCYATGEHYEVIFLIKFFFN